MNNIKAEDFSQVLNYLYTNGNCAQNMSIQRIARFTSFSESKVKSMIDILVKKNIVTKDFRLTRSGANYYNDLMNVLRVLE